MQQDFFQPQKVIGADIYFLRWILHNWPDKECVAILKNIVPALKKGARVMVSEIVLPEPNTLPLRLDRDLRVMDVHMLNVFGSKERDANMFEALFAAADARFKFLGVKPLANSQLSIIEAEWTG